ncbi:S-layer homology domain-containing protein [Paenibacillus puldeungensis]|uniref:S-layer homology domain-containing protein n=1 Tax=Paenibacillus puldeungensis TaxID=696536 RepID=A0ABW3RUD1_9BACL
MKKIITMLTLAVLLYSVAIYQKESVSANDLPYQDIDGSYAREAIVRLNENSIMKGTSSSLFSPTRSITRAEFMTTLVRIFKLESVASSVPAYRDVAKSAWYYGTVQAATEIGLTEGVGNSLFKPVTPLTRQEAAAWIVRALKQNDTSNTAPTGFKDDASIADWARPYINTVSQLGLMEGNDGKFNPNQSITRQETAVILDRILQNDRWGGAIAKTTNSRETIQLGWQYGQSTEAYQQSIVNSNVNVLAPRWFFLESTGRFSDHSVPSLATWAKTNNKQIWALVGNRFDQEATHKLLSSSQLSAAAIQDLKSFIQKYELNGINLDFENVQASDRNLFTSFVASLADELHTISASLSVDLPPDLESDWSAAYNYEQLGKSADYIVIMAYDEHWSGYTAGPVASLPWAQKHLDKLLPRISADKLILGMPLYNRDWTISSQGTTLTSEDVLLPEQYKRMNLYGAAAKWNTTLGQYTMDYWTSGALHRIWLEDSRSLAQKYKMAANRNIAGYAYWHIGGESPDIWTSLQNTEKYGEYTFK